MTRKQVAQRLGKSIATVRRLEGVLLHPAPDPRGRVHFDGSEVEQLVGAMERGEVTLWQHMRGTSEPLEGEPMPVSKYCADCNERERELSLVRAELAEEGRRHRRELESVRAERDRDREAHRTEQQQLERELRRFVAEVMRA